MIIQGTLKQGGEFIYWDEFGRIFENVSVPTLKYMNLGKTKDIKIPCFIQPSLVHEDSVKLYEAPTTLPANLKKFTSANIRIDFEYHMNDKKSWLLCATSILHLLQDLDFLPRLPIEDIPQPILQFQRYIIINNLNDDLDVMFDFCAGLSCPCLGCHNYTTYSADDFMQILGSLLQKRLQDTITGDVKGFY